MNEKYLFLVLDWFFFRYLPGIQLTPNIIANSNVVDCCKDASILIFCIPHQVYVISTFYNLSLLKVFVCN